MTANNEQRLDRLKRALRNAHNAGDTGAAKRLAKAIKASEQPLLENAPTAYLKTQPEFRQADIEAQQRKLAEETGPVESFLVGAGRQFDKLGSGLKQLPYEVVSSTVGGFPGMLAEREARNIDEQEFQADKEIAPLREQSPISVGAGEITTDATTGMLIPGGTGAGLIRKTAGGAAAGGAQEALKPGDFEQRLNQGLVGAGGGAIGGGVAHNIEKGANMIRGRYKTPEIQERTELFEQYGIKPTLGDRTQNPTIQKAESTLETIGFGKKFRQKGASRTQEILENTRLGLQDDAAIPANVLRGRTEYVDPEEAILDGINRTLDKQKGIADVYYKQMGKLAGNQPIEAENLMRTANNILGRQSQVSDEAARVLSPIQNKIEAFASGPAGTFQGLRDIRTSLSDMLRDKDMLVNTNARREITRLRNAVDQDIRDYAETQGGDLLKLMNKADQHYRKSVAPFKDKFVNSLAGGNEDRVIPRLVNANKYSDIRKLYGAVDEKGRAAIRFGVIDTILENSTNKSTGFISPARFALNMNKFDKTMGKFFPPDQKAQLTGLAKLMDYSRRFGQFAENPPTGNRVLSGAPTLGAAAIGSTVGDSAGEVSSILLKYNGALWLASMAARNQTLGKYLTAASKYKPDSPEMGAILNRLEKAMITTADELIKQDKQEAFNEEYQRRVEVNNRMNPSRDRQRDPSRYRNR